jgi:hypothetical protein
LEKFKEEAIKNLNPVSRIPKKLRNINYTAVRVGIMKKLEEISSQCYENLDINQGKMRAEHPCTDPFKYEPIRFSDPREISISR